MWWTRVGLVVPVLLLMTRSQELQNVALKKVAVQISNSDTSPLAVDGGVSSSDQSLCARTDLHDVPWFRVDLGEEFHIQSIRIHTLSPCDGEGKVLRIFVTSREETPRPELKEEGAECQERAAKLEPIIDVKCVKVGRFVLISTGRLAEPFATQNRLCLCEVEVFADASSPQSTEPRSTNQNAPPTEIDLLEMRVTTSEKSLVRSTVPPSRSSAQVKQETNTALEGASREETAMTSTNDRSRTIIYPSLTGGQTEIRTAQLSPVTVTPDLRMTVVQETVVFLQSSHAPLSENADEFVGTSVPHVYETTQLSRDISDVTVISITETPQESSLLHTAGAAVSDPLSRRDVPSAPTNVIHFADDSFSATLYGNSAESTLVSETSVVENLCSLAMGTERCVVVSTPLPLTGTEQYVISTPLPLTGTEQYVISTPLPLTGTEQYVISTPFSLASTERHVISTTRLPGTTPIEPNSCECPCHRPITDNTDSDTFMSSLLLDLDIPSWNLTAYRRRLKSAPDDRPLARGMGYSAALLLIIVFGSVVAGDIVTVLRHMHGASWWRSMH